MKKEIWLYLSAFLSGILIINLLDSVLENNNDILNRYTLASLTFQEIVYEKYFIHILFLRLRTVVCLWAVSKLLTKKIVKISFLAGICILLGGIAAMSILANGIWGMWFFIMSLFPHIFFYGAGYGIWYCMQTSYEIERMNRGSRLSQALIFILIVIGCVCEAYINPVLLEYIIKI